jgi:alginate O-acetyltransferase complex protein AlgI
MYFISGTSGILHLNVFMSLETVTILVLAIIFSVPWHRIIIIKTPKTVTIANYLNTIFMLVLFLLCISNLASETYNPFIYFRF